MITIFQAKLDLKFTLLEKSAIHINRTATFEKNKISVRKIRIYHSDLILQRFKRIYEIALFKWGHLKLRLQFF